MRYSRGIRRSCEPGIRYPRRRPESNHLLTVRGATLQILATCPVVKTFIAGSPVHSLVCVAASLAVRIPLASLGPRPVLVRLVRSFSPAVGRAGRAQAFCVGAKPAGLGL